VGYTALRIVISAYAFRAIARAHQALALRGLFIVLLLLLLVFQARGQHLQSLVLVAMLRPIVLALHHQSSRQMGYTHSRVRLVDVLPAGATRPKGIDTQIGRIDHNVALRISLGQY